jgi:hypothetical protein
MIRHLLYTTIIFCLFFVTYLFPQKEINSSYTESSIPALEKFHILIYKMWDTAYPAKDYSSLRGYAGEVKLYADKLYKAKLPGTLQINQELWNAGIKDLRNAVNEYIQICAGDNDNNLLAAVNVLYSRYEKLAEIVQPFLLAIGEFHLLLSTIYHSYLPDREYDKILFYAGRMKEKAEIISRTIIPKGLELRAEEIHTSTEQLLTAVKKLAAFDETSKGEEIELAIDDINTKYQDLTELCFSSPPGYSNQR